MHQNNIMLRILENSWVIFFFNRTNVQFQFLSVHVHKPCLITCTSNKIPEGTREVDAYDQ